MKQKIFAILAAVAIMLGMGSCSTEDNPTMPSVDVESLEQSLVGIWWDEYEYADVTEDGVPFTRALLAVKADADHTGCIYLGVFDDKSDEPVAVYGGPEEAGFKWQLKADGTIVLTDPVTGDSYTLARTRGEGGSYGEKMTDVSATNMAYTDGSVTVTNDSYSGTLKKADAGKEAEIENTLATPSAATIEYTASDYSGTYDGTAHGINLSVTTSGATVKYRTASSGEYDLTEAPTYTNAGDARTVYFQITKDNYTTVEGSNTVTINKAAATATLSSTNVDFGTSTADNTVTVSDNTGNVSAEVTDGSGCSVSVSGTTITVSRSSDAAFSATVTVTIAASDDGNYASGTRTFTVSGTYTKMSNATASDIGKVICSNGHIHATVSAVTCGGTASAMIAYVGDQNDAAGSGAYSSTYNHGLAVALTDVSNTSGEEGPSTMDWSDAGKAAGAYKRSRPSASSAWFLPSLYQWQRMFIGCNSSNSFVSNWTEDSGSFDHGNFCTKLKNCGGTDVKDDRYWSSTEYSSSYAWRYSFFSSKFFWSDRMNYTYVRAVFAF